ncbi:PVC-type heme-binding CxxCH protein [Singulisphaera acidiphila]|uniref:Putative membrane-bound dehydrogenase n=1 Tax=Singulisphaera acidiphila (strain ATCC BAA-1392 / DSM 18658 / VKM B-2454 / MOB10) TaxID=886293 RepID=L0DCT6_SINAD|nr:PVC-type heme-binding CxxCH protein [Singulisphaera acidiphila]AGA27057.1 putative membrane-bound dehydrogenase [Singulisphaera acidiphila DSM 18658]
MRLRTRLAALSFLALGLFSANVHAVDPASTKGKPLAVLFLGDRGPHRPFERFEQLAPVLAGRGIELTYTDKTSDLNPQNLGKYDALAIYANTTQISKEQEKALLDYVSGGGGFVPLHCASFCFLNSPGYIALVGAQFLKHGTGQFETTVADPDHAIIKGLEPFRTWDETYVHTKHNTKDRQLLQTRDDQTGSEPWTWVRTQGKGRVFYTAYGHDARTWGHPGFHDLVERGIRWAANKGGVSDSRPRVPKGLKPFEHEKAEIPLYTQGARWGTLGEPIRRMQKPLTPEESIKHLASPEGFEAKLFVSEPQIGKPISMTWDHKGRLYVAETVDYPNEMQPKGQGRDRISIVEDTDGDGRADTKTIFAENLSIPTSLCYANGGLIVAQAPDMLFLRDTDGDGKADEREVLFTGFKTNDTHAGPSNLRFGLDNWIYAIIGYAGFTGDVGGERLNFRQGFFRFKPDGSKLEFLRSTNNNSWGVGISEEGLLFGSTANGCPSVYMPIPNRYYESVKGMAPAVLANMADSNRFFPVTENVRQVDWHGGFTAGAGSALYTARAFPKPYWNRTAFVAEPTGHLVSAFTLHQDGTDFRSHNAWNLVASDDEWTSPIIAEVGPDGQVWMVDWYNFIVQHNPTPEGYKTGKGGAYEIPLRDKTHGRIYRIVAKDGKPSDQPKLSKDDPKGLVAALKNDNMFWRLHAQRLLVERGKTDVKDDLLTIIEQDRSQDALGLTPAVIHALWAASGLGVLDGDGPSLAGVQKAAFTHPSASVRRNAALAFPPNVAAPLVVKYELLKDDEKLVRLAALLALADAGSDESKSVAVASAVFNGSVDNDRWLSDAAAAAGAQDASAFLLNAAIRKTPKGPSPEAVSVVSRVSEHYARSAGNPVLGEILRQLPEADAKVREAMVAGFAKGWPRDKAPELDAEAEKAIAALLPKLATDSRGQMLGLASRWGLKGLDGYVAQLAKDLLTVAADSAKSDSARINAARQLVDLRKDDAQAARDIIALVTAKSPPEVASGLIGAVSRSDSPEVGTALVDSMGPMTPAARQAVALALLGKTDWTGSLVGGIEAGKVPMSLLTLSQSQALAAHPDKSIADRARALLAKGDGLPNPDREKVIQALSAVMLKGGDASRGKEVFKKECAKCHTHSGEGGKVGPDLTGMAAHPKSELIVHILDPSRSVEGNFLQYTVSTTDGRVTNGLLAGETKTSIELLDAEGKKLTILRDDIEELASSQKSLMPEGFEKTIPAEGLADLLQFLVQKGKYLLLDLRKVATVTTTKPLVSEAMPNPTRLVFEDWGPKVVDGVPFALVDPQGDRVPNAVMLQSTFGTIPPRMPKEVSLPVNATARAIHLLSGVSIFGFPAGREGSVSLIVRITYEDGSTEAHELKNGVHFADVNGAKDVPGSKLAYKLGGQQVRYLTVVPQKQQTIARIELVKGSDRSAPIVLAATIEGFE